MTHYQSDQIMTEMKNMIQRSHQIKMLNLSDKGLSEEETLNLVETLVQSKSLAVIESLPKIELDGECDS